jgi:hypothetical protein
MAAATGASLRELMERMGHSSPRAALIYQHATRERDDVIAAAMGEAFVSARRKGASSRRSGTQEAGRVVMAGCGLARLPRGLCFRGGAGDGNRTRMTSLEGFEYDDAELCLRRSVAQRPVRG